MRNGQPRFCLYSDHGPGRWNRACELDDSDESVAAGCDLDDAKQLSLHWEEIPSESTGENLDAGDDAWNVDVLDSARNRPGGRRDE